MSKNLFMVAKGNNTYLMLPKEEKSYFDFDIVHTIPSTRIIYSMEISINNNVKRIFVIYWANNKEQVLESFDLDLECRFVRDINKRYANGCIEVISPTAFCYKDENNLKTMLSVYGNIVLPQKRVYNRATGMNLEITDVTFGDYIDREKREVILHIGTEEKIHIFVTWPTKMYQAFRVYRQVYSELLDKQYDLFPNCNFDFVDYGIFNRTFIDSKLAEKIIVESKNHKDNIKKQVLALRKTTEDNQ